MIAQILFFSLLYVVGLLVATAVKGRVPLMFIAITGFLWGSLIWVLLVICLLILGVPLTATSTGLGLLLLTGAALVWHIRRGSWQHIAGQAWRGSAGIAGLMFIIIVVIAQFNNSIVSPDSTYMLQTASQLISDGLADHVVADLSSRSIFLPAMHSAANLFGMDYFYSLQPLYFSIFCLTFVYLAVMAMAHIGVSRPWQSIILLTVGIVWFSSYFVIYQALYIHTNFNSGLYLLVGIGCFWLAHTTTQQDWLLLGAAAMIGFTLWRVEAPLFAVLFLGIWFAGNQVPYRSRWQSIMVYSVPVFIWYAVLWLRLGSLETVHLDPMRVVLILLAIAGLNGVVFFSNRAWLYRWLLRFRLVLLVAGLTLVLLVLVYLKGWHMWESFLNLIDDMLPLRGWWWGGIWLFAGVSLAYLLLNQLLRRRPFLPLEFYFLTTTLVFYQMMLALVFLRRNPYYVGLQDSGNRMLAHILPLILFYLVLKWAWTLKQANAAERTTSQ